MTVDGSACPNPHHLHAIASSGGGSFCMQVPSFCLASYFFFFFFMAHASAATSTTASNVGLAKQCVAKQLADADAFPDRAVLPG